MVDTELEGMTGDITIDKTLWGIHVSSECDIPSACSW